MLRRGERLTMMAVPAFNVPQSNVATQSACTHPFQVPQQCRSAWELTTSDSSPSLSAQGAATPKPAVSNTTNAAASAGCYRSHRYTHNPYASTAPRSDNDGADPVCVSGSGDGNCEAPRHVYNSAALDSGNLSNGLVERFRAIVGELPRAACTSAGRNLLVSVLRLHHVEMTRTVVDEFRPVLPAVALDSNGCHVVRALVEFIPTGLMATLVPHFTPSLVRDLAVSSPYTRRVLQSVFERHKSDALTPIVEAIAQDSQLLAQRQQGCITIIRTIENTLPHQQRFIISRLLPALPALTMNCYGNYVVQCVLHHMDPEAVTVVVCHAFAGHWVALSCNKFASNVVEKVVRVLEGPARRALIAETVCDPVNLRRLMNDCFGNFVLQAIIDSSTSEVDFRTISQCIRPLLPTSSHGRRIESKLQCVMARAGAVGE
ncbi:pumilio/PUF RNA binding protein 5 [Trypanosoma equiperdum]|uniref:Pumilio/PUF RNA binding protein 5 n=1 Tax=Trypanosoma equiperdum TaxID=5694 RepID=A0A1G4IIP8_TRYEQ|nr:pumilio/PUF RNA binding protein 5 [Trypanosoma equiperdum]